MRGFKLINKLFLKSFEICAFNSIDFNFKFIVMLLLLLALSYASPIAKYIILRCIVKCNGSNMPIIHDFKNNVLIAVAERAAENVGAIC